MLDFGTTSSYVDPTGFPHGGKYFLFPQNRAERWLGVRVVHSTHHLKTFRPSLRSSHKMGGSRPCMLL
jgi:hypothetical protein